MNASQRSLPQSARHTVRRVAKPIRYRPHVYKYTLENNPDAMEVVFALINGTEINDIDPQLFPAMLPLLREKEKQLKEWRNQPASKTIADAIEHITHYKYSEDPNQNPQLLVRAIQSQPPGVTQEDVDFAVKLILTGHSVDQIDPAVRSKTIKELSHKRTEALQNGDYLLAERCVITSRQLMELENTDRYEEIQTQKADEVYDKYNTAQIEFQKVKEDCERRIKEADEIRTKTLQDLDKADAKELKEFDKIFETEVPPQFRKFSSTILQLRKREQYMVTCGRYSEANAVRAEAVALEEKEREQQKARYLAELNLKRQEFIKKQQEKHEAKVLAANNAYDKVVVQTREEMDRAEKSLKKLQDRANELDKAALLAAREARVKAAQKNGEAPRKSDAEMFRQRAKINSIVYTRTLTPRGSTTKTFKNHLF